MVLLGLTTRRERDDAQYSFAAFLLLLFTAAAIPPSSSISISGLADAAVDAEAAPALLALPPRALRRAGVVTTFFALAGVEVDAEAEAAVPPLLVRRVVRGDAWGLTVSSGTRSTSSVVLGSRSSVSSPASSSFFFSPPSSSSTPLILSAVSRPLCPKSTACKLDRSSRW